MLATRFFLEDFDITHCWSFEFTLLALLLRAATRSLVIRNTALSCHIPAALLICLALAHRAQALEYLWSQIIALILEIS
jgi:hypothetical protein